MKQQFSKEYQDISNAISEAVDRLQSFGLNQTTGINNYTSKDRQTMRAAINEFRLSLANAGYKITKK
jgi:hypothetical protein